MNQSFLLPNQPILTHDAKCMIMRVGRLFERCVEEKAETLVKGRLGAAILPDDVLAVTRALIDENFDDLVLIIKEVLETGQFKKVA